MSAEIPRWDLTNVYPGLDSQELSSDQDNLESQITDLENFFSSQVSILSNETPPEIIADRLNVLIDQVNQVMILSSTIRVYIYSFFVTDSFNQHARKLLSQFDLTSLRLQKLMLKIESMVGSISEVLDLVLEFPGTAKEHGFFLKETAEQSKYLMGEKEESLAVELSLSGANAWMKLQGTITSQLSVDFEIDGNIKAISMPELINLHAHPDESVRRQAYELELSTWEKVKEPLAAALNGIKGTNNTLNKRRGRQDAVHSSLDDSRIDRATLEVMLEAMHDSFPLFHQYFRKKAARIGKEKLAWWDIFAPTGNSSMRYTFDQAEKLILTHFEQFSPELSGMADQAFKKHWIDAEPRVGKRGGAFCTTLPGVKESRILCNFDGTLNQVSTIAHELGHAFHNHCMYQAGKQPLQRNTPLTMAETASIMCETIIIDAALSQINDPNEELAILETRLIGDAQVIVDIYARYLFEKEVFQRREAAELSADELCEIMEQAQKDTYGEGLNQEFLHKYMWTWKPHYYYPGRSFYNYPYAFGLLFGLGLYAIYMERGASFVPDYIGLLSSTGEGQAADLAARFNIDIRKKSFWEKSLGTIANRIERYIEL